MAKSQMRIGEGSSGYLRIVGVIRLRFRVGEADGDESEGRAATMFEREKRVVSVCGEWSNGE